MRQELTQRRLFRIAAAAVLLLAAAPAMAELRAGAMGATNMAEMTAKDDTNNSLWLTRWGVGGVVELDLTPEVVLVARPAYIGKGADAPLLPVSKVRTELGYIELPVLVKLQLATHDWRPYLIAGPSLGLLQSAKAVQELDGGGEERLDVKDDFKTADWGVNVGAGLAWRAGKAQVFAEGLWGLGLSNVKKAGGESKNRSFRLQAGVTLRLGGR